MSPPILSALVLNYRTPQQTVKCVQALLKQTIIDRMEIVVIDNHSEDDSLGVLQNRLAPFPNVHIVEMPRNEGFSKGYNKGESFIHGQYILINNPAKLLAPDGAEKMMQAMERDPSIGILGPRLVHEDGTTRDSYRTFPRLTDIIIKRTILRRFFPQRLAAYIKSHADPLREQDTDWVIGGCLLMRRSLYEQLGGFDEDFFLFFEDIDLCQRTWKAGKRVVYFPQALATDRKRRLSEGGIATLLLTRTGRTHIASALRYFWKWRNG